MVKHIVVALVIALAFVGGAALATFMDASIIEDYSDSLKRSTQVLTKCAAQATEYRNDLNICVAVVEDSTKENEHCFRQLQKCAGVYK